jgi:hypothetical protein
VVSALSDRLLEAIEQRENVARHAMAGPWNWSTGEPESFFGTGPVAAHVAANDPTAVIRTCAAHRRIVHRYLDAVLEATTANQVGTPALYAERRVAVLADVLDDLATAYGITR